MTNGASLMLGLYYRDASRNQVVVAATNIVYSTALFPDNTNFIDFSAQLDTVQAGDAWAGQHIGILLLSTVGFDLMGGYWDLDNVRLTSASAPVLSGWTAANGQFAFTLQSDPGAACEVLAAADPSLPASQWTSLGAVTNLTGWMIFMDNTLTNAGKRFYQARLVDQPERRMRTISHRRRPGVWTLSALPASLIWAADHILCSQAKGLTYTSPGQRPGFACGSILLQANGLPHTFHLSRSAQIPTRRRNAVRSIVIMNRAFSAQNGLWPINPGRCPGLV